MLINPLNAFYNESYPSDITGLDRREGFGYPEHKSLCERGFLATWDSSTVLPKIPLSRRSRSKLPSKVHLALCLPSILPSEMGAKMPCSGFYPNSLHLVTCEGVPPCISAARKLFLPSLALEEENLLPTVNEFLNN